MPRARPFGTLLHGASLQPDTTPTRLTPLRPAAPNPGALDFFAYLPATLPRRAPLVVVLHGCTQTAAGYDAASGWSTLADRHGFALLFPQQRRANNANGCFNWFDAADIARGGGEAQSIVEAVGFLAGSAGLDPARVFISGLSAGGAMASALCAAYPDVFAGAAIIAGLPAGNIASVNGALVAMRTPPVTNAVQLGDHVREASRFDGPWPRVTIWHGDADRTVAATNGDAVAAQWCDVQGITTPPTVTTAGRDTIRRWSNAAGVVVVEQHLIAGMAHGTPIAAGSSGIEPAPFMLDVGIDSAAASLAFWGVATDRPAAARPVRAAKPTVAPATARKPDAVSVVQAALRAAGLLR